jgi:hypothetical protein
MTPTPNRPSLKTSMRRFGVRCQYLASPDELMQHVSSLRPHERRSEQLLVESNRTIRNGNRRSRGGLNKRRYLDPCLLDPHSTLPKS